MPFEERGEGAIERLAVDVRHHPVPRRFGEIAHLVQHVAEELEDPRVRRLGDEGTLQAVARLPETTGRHLGFGSLQRPHEGSVHVRARGAGLELRCAGVTHGWGSSMSDVRLRPTSDPVSADVALGVGININAFDAKALIRWMQDVLGFDLVALYEDLDDGHVRASRLELGNHAVHVSQRGPASTAPRNGVGIGVVAASDAAVDALYARAKAAGAEIVSERERAMTGSYRFSVRDTEGDVWGVGTTWHDKPESLALPERVI